MTNTVKAVLSHANYEDRNEWEIWVPEAKYTEDPGWYQSYGYQLYEIPAELAGKFEAACEARDQVDEEISRIIKEGTGKCPRPGTR